MLTKSEHFFFFYMHAVKIYHKHQLKENITSLNNLFVFLAWLF